MKKIIQHAMLCLCAVLFTGCIQSPSISYQSISLKPTSFQDIQTSLVFSIANPNLIPLKGVIDYTLKVNDQEFFAGTSSEINVDSQKTSAFTLDHTVNLPKTFGSLAQLVNDIGQGKKEIPYSIEGTYRTTLVGININAPLKAAGVITLPRLPIINLKSVSIEKFDIRNPGLKITAQIENPNDFPLQINQSIYELAGNNNALGNIKLDQPLAITAGGTQDITLHATIDGSKISTKLLQELLSNKVDFNLLQKELSL